MHLKNPFIRPQSIHLRGFPAESASSHCLLVWRLNSGNKPPCNLFYRIVVIGGKSE